MHILSRRTIRTFFMGLIAASLLLAVDVAQGQGSEGPIRTDCVECHETVVTNWKDSAHGQASTNDAFLHDWQEKGSQAECMSCHTTGYDSESETWMAEGIHCSVCHSGQSGPHPETPMPTDPSSRLCGTCHIDTYNEWEISEHGQGEMACVRCHNPHTATLKVGGMQDLCMTCHNEEGHFYAYTDHAEKGLACTDCHLQVSDNPMGDGHGKRQHTFSVDLETCNSCHSDSMHYPTDGASIEGSSNVNPAAYTTSEEVACAYEGEILTEDPTVTSAHPWGYLLVAAAGAGLGVAVSPWAEDWYRRLNGRS